MEALAVECAESIALLKLLHSVPIKPQANSLSHLPVSEKGYTLSFEQERRLASILAFLSSINNDSNYIPAICLGEERKHSLLNVLLSVNKSNKDDGNHVLRELEHGFKNLFSILSRASNVRADAVHIELEVFSAIVTMCSSRILGRLRLKRASGRLSIAKILKDTRSLLQKTGPPAMFSLFAETFEGVIKLVDAWSGYQAQDALEALVDGIYRLQQTKDVSSVIDGIPNRWMVPTTRTSLLNMIMKVARYRESAGILRRLAQKCPLLRRMELVLVQLGASAFGRVPVKQLEPDLASKIPQKEKKKKKNNPYSIENICRLLGTKAPQASKLYAQQTRRTLTEGKVHAEIQLLFYVEQEKPEFPPRVVCSSKDACFLCNTFIAMHGKIHTPRTHGRLYPGWRLPSIGNKDLHTKFVKHLDNLIKSDILLLSARGKKTEYPFPNESTLLTLPVSTSTLSSRATHHSTTLSMRDLPPPPPPPLETVEEAVVESINDTPEPLKVLGAGPRSDGEPSATRATAVMTPTTKNSPEANDERLNRDASLISSLSEVVSSMSVHDSTQLPGSVRLPETVGANGTSPFYSDGVLEVQVEYAASATASGGVPKRLPFSIEWLGDVEEVNRARDVQAQPIFDAESSEAEISLSLNDQNSVYITAKGSLAKLTFGRPQGV